MKATPLSASAGQGPWPVRPLPETHLLITATSFGKADPRLREEVEAQVAQVSYNPFGRPLTAEELRPLLAEVDGYIAGLDEISALALEACPRLRVIARYGSGVDNVDLRTAAQRGIVVTNTPGANAASVAELTVALMLALARDLPAAAHATRHGEWPRTVGLSLQGKTVGLVGLGAIGKEVARRLAGFDCALLACDLLPDEALARSHGVRFTTLSDLLSAADIVSLHLPLAADTRGLVNRSFLQKMKPGALLVNTARGELVDEAALAEALRCGHLRGAALDVYALEPPPRDHPLFSLAQVIATPHMGAHTDGAMNAMGRAALTDCLAVLSGKPALHRVV